MDLKAIDELLASLNEDQRRVAEIGPGSIAVSGSPGSGKTRCVIARIARMARDGLDPKYVLAMTFTRNAAAEMNERLTKLGILTCRVGTIHSLSLQILQESTPLLISTLRIDESGFKLDRELRATLGDMRRDRLINKQTKPDVDGIKHFIEVFDSGGLIPTFGNTFGVNVEATTRLRKEAQDWYHATGLAGSQLAELYLRFEHRRAAASLYSFDKMQSWAWQALLLMPEVRASWRRYSVVIVDENQDSSRIQIDVARMLAGGASRMYPDRTPDDPKVPPILAVHQQASQSLYSWRAAVPEWGIEFAKQKGVGFFTLPINYRSTPEICYVANAIVRGEEWHLEGDMRTPSNEEPTLTGFEEAFELVRYKDLYAEVNGALDWMAKVCDGSWSNGVVLARLAMALHLMEIECIRRKIPYEKRASGSFFDSKEVLDLVSYLRVAGGWDKEDFSWTKRCIRVPFRYIGRNALDWASMECRRTRSQDFLDMLTTAPMLSIRQVRSLSELQKTLAEVSAMIEHGCTPAACIRFVIEDTFYWDWLKEEGGANRIDASKIAVIEHMLKLGEAVESVSDFVAQIDNLSAGVAIGRKEAQKKEGDRLILSTVHRAKGLEFQNVAILDLADGRFPWNKGHSPDEERRLLFVAVTRAKKRVRVSCSGKPSAHFKELASIIDKAKAQFIVLDEKGQE